MSEQCDHAFKVLVNTSKFEAVVAQSCKAAYAVEMIAHDPTVIPHVRVFNVVFASPEDRDRVRIAMRFLEKEQAELAKVKSQPPGPTLARRLVSA
ncbi:MAG: hypothetical protein AB7H70_08595 [Rhodospirillaceae bacterium]